MMNPVVTGRVEHEFQGTQSGDDLGVEPEHVELSQLKVCQKDLRRNPSQRQRNVCYLQLFANHSKSVIVSGCQLAVLTQAVNGWSTACLRPAIKVKSSALWCA